MVYPGLWSDRVKELPFGKRKLSDALDISRLIFRFNNVIKIPLGVPVLGKSATSQHKLRFKHS